MRRLAVTALVCLALGSSAAAAAPITKQNGSNPLFKDFTSICAVPGYLTFGFCSGNATTFADIAGRINAIQAKESRWNLGFTFTHLTPGATYRLWGNQAGATPVAGNISGFFPIATGVAEPDGSVRFSYQTGNPTNLGFDLNILDHPWSYNGVTLVTSYWSQQWIQVLNDDGTLHAASS